MDHARTASDASTLGNLATPCLVREHVIGPVVAEELDDARALIEAALAPLGPTFVRIDTAASTQPGPWLDSIGLAQVSEATTMVQGSPALPSGPGRMFALANQSFN